LGLWCPHCKKSIKEEIKPIEKTKWLSFWIFRLMFGSMIGIFVSIGNIFNYRYYENNIIITFILFVILFFFFTISVAVGLINRKMWAWKANWVIIFGEPLLISLRETSDKGSMEHQIGFFIGMMGGALLLWIWPNYVYFKKRRTLFS
jgi:hypothetical protein